MRRTVTVLQDDIDKGKRRSPVSCAVARAVSRELADLGDGSFAAGRAELTFFPACENEEEGGVIRYFRFPREVTRFICLFDRGDPVEPFKFELEVP